MERSIAIVGAGITGLAAADHLTRMDGPPAVTVFEAGARVGGRIATSPFAGVAAVDEGADAFLARVPEALDLANDVGLGLMLRHPEPVGAAVWHDGLHDIPDGLLLGVPGKLLPMARTGLLSWRGKLRAAMEPFLPRTSLSDDSIGTFVRRRFGDEVHERLVDALVGSIYATDTDRFSLAEVPQLRALASNHRSMLLGARAMRAQAGTGSAASGAIFAAPSGGIAALTTAAAEAVANAGGTIRLDSPVSELRPIGTGSSSASSSGWPSGWPSGWMVNGERFDAVIFTASAQATSAVLRPTADAASTLLDQAESADVILVSLHIAADQWPDRLSGRSGYLVPKPVQRWVTAASFGSQKWAHWRPPGGGQILRVSIGRDGRPVMHLTDEEVIEHVLADLHRHLGVEFSPIEVRVSRWPGAFAQYRPHHARWVDAVENELPPGVFVAGSSYRGIGLPACIRQGRTIAELAAAHAIRLAD